MQNASGNDQVKGAIEPADIQQAQLPDFEVGEAVLVAVTLGMRKAGLGKIDTEDSTVRVVEGDQSRLEEPQPAHRMRRSPRGRPSGHN